MQLSLRAIWLCMATLVLGSQSDYRVRPLEIDLVFPRNDTYAPTPNFPIVFGIQNAELAQHLKLEISVTITNDSYSSFDQYTEDLISANFSSAEPYFAYSSISNKFEVEGRWQIRWSLWYYGCMKDENREYGGGTRAYSSEPQIIDFTIKNDGRPIDLVATTAADDKTCLPDQGAIIEVTNITAKVGDETCVAVTTTEPAPTPYPCLVKVDSAAAASISASSLQRCKNLNGTNNSTDCSSEGNTTGSPAGPPENTGLPENAAQQLAVVGAVACWTAALGAFGFLLL